MESNSRPNILSSEELTLISKTKALQKNLYKHIIAFWGVGLIIGSTYPIQFSLSGNETPNPILDIVRIGFVGSIMLPLFGLVKNGLSYVWLSKQAADIRNNQND